MFPTLSYCPVFFKEQFLGFYTTIKNLHSKCINDLCTGTMSSPPVMRQILDINKIFANNPNDLSSNNTETDKQHLRTRGLIVQLLKLFKWQYTRVTTRNAVPLRLLWDIYPASTLSSENSQLDSFNNVSGATMPASWWQFIFGSNPRLGNNKGGTRTEDTVSNTAAYCQKIAHSL